MTAKVTVVKRVDTLGLLCPLPIIRLESALGDVARGDVVALSSDDPAFEDDLLAWSQATGNRVLEIGTDVNGSFVVMVQKC